MSESSDAAEQVVRMMLSGGEVAIRLSGSALKNGAALLLALSKNHKKIYGKVSLRRMLNETRDIRTFPMQPEEYRQFATHAKRLKILFSAIQDKHDLRADAVCPFGIGAASPGEYPAGGTPAKKRVSVGTRLTRYKGQLLYMERQRPREDDA